MFAERFSDGGNASGRQFEDGARARAVCWDIGFTMRTLNARMMTMIVDVLFEVLDDVRIELDVVFGVRSGGELCFVKWEKAILFLYIRLISADIQFESW